MRARLRRWFGRRGRILAVRFGHNPNSSSLGVDVTFLLFGIGAVALITPLIGLLLRARGLLGGGASATAAAAGGRPGGPAAPALDQSGG